MTAHRPRKRFGQHFLQDPGTVEAILRAVSARPDETIVEIGPGKGILTQRLAETAGTLHAIELDRDLATQLRRDFESVNNVTIHQADALRFDYGSIEGPIRVVGNLPYNISTPLLFALLRFRDQVLDMHFMLQKEVVDRMAADPGSKNYGRLGIMLGCRFAIDALFDVDRLCFDPPPAVTSSVVRLVPLPPGTYDINDEERLSRLVATAFSQRRKTIRNALRNVADQEALRSAGIDPGLRPESISIADYVRLSNTLE